MFHLSLIPGCYEKWKMQLNAFLKPSPRVLFTILPALNRLSSDVATLLCIGWLYEALENPPVR